MKRFLASFLLASSLTTLSFARSTVVKPAPVDIQVKLDRAAVRAKLEARRKEVIERFLAYREARVYPWNRAPGAQHLWFDDMGNLCAAATLISYDWGRESTMKVGETNRGIQLARVKKGELADWILTSGLTHHEIVAIQVPPMGDMEDPRRRGETDRLYAMYTDVERQLTTLNDENLDLATDALMKRPDLARALLAGNLPGPGRYKVEPPAPEPTPEPTPEPAPELHSEISQ